MASKTKPAEDAIDASLPLEKPAVDLATPADDTAALPGPDAPEPATDGGVDGMTPDAGGEGLAAPDQAAAEAAATEATTAEAAAAEAAATEATTAEAAAAEAAAAEAAAAEAAATEATTAEAAAAEAAAAEAAERAAAHQARIDLLDEVGRRTAHGAIDGKTRAFLTKAGAVIEETDEVASIELAGIRAASPYGLLRAVLDWHMTLTRQLMTEAV